MTRNELSQALDKLGESIARLRDEYPDEGDFWCAFAGMAEPIEDSASAADCEYVSRRIDTILAAAGLAEGGTV